jgi:cyclopropane fatty-acyl-phospholipid synthase-like methyltransferase
MRDVGMKMMNPKDIVREGYDRVSGAYREDDYHAGDDPCYGHCVGLLLSHLTEGSRILDLGCGCGVPVARDLALRYDVTGVDISPVQIGRARSLVPTAKFICADMTTLDNLVGAFDAIISLYAIIHVPLEEQLELFARMASWLKPGGWLLCTVGHHAWTGTEEDWLGVSGGKMYWSHSDQRTYEDWLAGLGFHTEALIFIPEGESGHAAFLAQKDANNAMQVDARTSRH